MPDTVETMGINVGDGVVLLYGIIDVAIRYNSYVFWAFGKFFRYLHLVQLKM